MAIQETLLEKIIWIYKKKAMINDEYNCLELSQLSQKLKNDNDNIETAWFCLCSDL